MISTFYNKFLDQFGNFLNALGFLLLTSEKNFKLLFFWWLTFIAFLRTMIHGYCFWNIFYDLFKCLQFLECCLNAILQFPSHLQQNLEKNTHTHTRLFFFEKSWAKFFLKLFAFAIQFQNKSWILFLRILPIWRNSCNFTLQKRILQKYVSS